MTPRILLVEDEQLVRTMMSDFLRHAGYEVLEADSADAALDLLESGTAVDLVFSDIRMPGEMDGRALAERIRVLWPGIRVLLATGYPTVGPLTEPIRPPVLQKPFLPRDVLIAVVKAIDTRPPASSAVH